MTMKQLAITIICACLALAAMAQVPKPDAARLRQAIKNRPAAATPVGQSKTGQVSLHQFMRERNLTPNDNRLLKKAPSRGIQRNQSDMIAVAEVQAIDDFDEDGLPIMSDDVYSLGWKASVSDDNVLNGFYGSYSIPIDYDDAGVPHLWTNYLVLDTVVGATSGTYRVDTIRTVLFLTENWYLGEPDDDLVGTVYDDGSIWFDGKYFIWFAEELIKYKRTGSAWTGYTYTYESTEYVDVISPMYSNLYLLQPNGVHECDYQFDLSSYDLSGVDMSTTDFSTLVVGGGGSSDPGSGDLVVINTGDVQTSGLHPKPIDPRRYMGPEQITLRQTAEQWNSWQSVLINSSGTLEAPIYMFQLDDSTLCVYNMYNAGYTASIITLHPDGSFTMPPQIMFYAGEEDYYNCSIEDETLYLGNTGNATNDSITWGTTVPVGIESKYPYKFDNNKLYFSNDNQFLIGSAQQPTIEINEGVDTYSFTAVSAEEGAIVMLLLLDDEGNIIMEVSNPYVVQRVNQEQVIYLAAIASVSGKNDSYYVQQYVVPAIEYPRGDTNHDRQVTIQDVTVLINYLLSGQWPN